MANNYTTKTAALKATKADINKLDAKKMLLNGKNILDYISDSEFNSYDTRDPQLKNDELDIWNTEISLSEEGHIEVKPHVHSAKDNFKLEGITQSQVNTLKTAVKVIDNEVLGANDEHIMYWQTDGLTVGDGDSMFFRSSNLIEFNSDLLNLTDGTYMFYVCSGIKSFSSDMPSLTNGRQMFAECTNLTTFSSNLPKLTDGEQMFYYCRNLTTFSSNMPSLTNANMMFYDCSALTAFSSDLPSLTNGNYMFQGCSALTTFSSDLPSLKDGEQMFYKCTALNSFTSNLSSLKVCKYMFARCTNLTTFTSNLSSLINGNYMFQGCSNLTSFNGNNLSSLIVGPQMFSSCKLDATSVANIVHSLTADIPDYAGNITIGIGCDNTEADQLLFAQECDCETWQELLDDFSAKNWTVTFQCNGRPTTTYNMRRGETLPVYTKLEEVTEGEHYDYTSADGSKFYNINYFHSTNGSTEGYDVFSSLEEAISTYNVTPKN